MIDVVVNSEITRHCAPRSFHTGACAQTFADACPRIYQRFKKRRARRIVHGSLNKSWQSASSVFQAKDFRQQDTFIWYAYGRMKFSWSTAPARDNGETDAGDTYDMSRKTRCS